MVPVLLTEDVCRSIDPGPLLLIVTLPLVAIPPEIVIPLLIPLLLIRVKAPVPVMAPDTVNTALPELLVLLKVVPALYTVMLPTASAEDPLFSVMAVTLGPTAPMLVVPLPVPELVIVPTLLRNVVLNVIVPLAALLAMVKLSGPLTPPLNVVETLLPVVPMVRVPTSALVASVIGLPNVRLSEPTSNVAGLLPLPLPKVMAPVPEPPNASALLTPSTVPAFIVKPPVKVLFPPKVNVPLPVLIMPTLPLVLMIFPLKLLVTLLLPMVKVPPGSVLLSTVPEPFKPLMTMEWLSKSKVPFTVTSP